MMIIIIILNMSRNPMHGESLDSHLKLGLKFGFKKGVENMANLAIVDPGKLRVPMGGGGGGTPRKPSWMTTVDGKFDGRSGIFDPHAPYCPDELGAGMETVCEAMEMPNLRHAAVVKQPRAAEGRPETAFLFAGRAWEIHGWALASGYSLFGLCLALCNLLAPQHASKVCTAVSPVPSLCLLLQSLTVVEASSSPESSSLDRCATLGSVGLLLAACALPSACVFWSPYLAIPLILVSALDRKSVV